MALFFVAGSLAELFAAPRKSASPPPAPPPAVPLTLRLPRGKSIDIPLRIHGTRAQTLEFRIRTPPAAGTLSNLKQTAPERAVVTYTAPTDLAIKRDRFSYAVRSREGVSAAAEVNITILDARPELLVPERLEFSTTVGTEKGAEIEIKNRGGTPAEGLFEVTAPWNIPGPADYRVAAGESHRVQISFNPSEVGRFRGELRYSSQRDRSTALEGEGRPVFVVTPSTLTLVHPRDETTRSAELELRNQTDQPQEIIFDVNDRLHLPRRLALAPGETQRITALLPADDVTAFSGEIIVGTTAHSSRIAVTAAPVPASVVVHPTHLQFGRVEPSTPAQGSVEIANRGGVPTTIVVEALPPFSVRDRELTIAPLSAAKLPITFSSAEEGAHRSELKIYSTNRQIHVLLHATVSSSRPAPRPVASKDRERPRLIAVAASGKSSPELVPERILVTSTTSTTATIEWPAELAPTLQYTAEQRQLSLHQRELKIDWVAYSAFRTEKNGDQIRGTFTGLAPGNSYMMRVIPLVAGTAALPLVEVQFRTLPKAPSPFRVTPLRILLALLVAAGSFLIWQRVRQRAD